MPAQPPRQKESTFIVAIVGHRALLPVLLLAAQGADGACSFPLQLRGRLFSLGRQCHGVKMGQLS